MTAIRKQSLLARPSQGASDSIRLEALAPERSASAAVSGMYFRAVRPSEVEVAAAPRREPAIDEAKVEGLRFELDMSLWRADIEQIARLLISEAGLAPELDVAEE